MKLTNEQLAVLNHLLQDGQAWADNAESHFGLELGTKHMIAKVAKNQASYDAAVAKSNYKTRKQRDETQAKEDKDRYDNASYSVKRQRSYPPIGDQLDALWKGGDDAEAMKAIVNKVKSDNPKG